MVYWPNYKDIDFTGILGQCSAEALGKLEAIVLYSEDTRPSQLLVAGKPAMSYASLLTRLPLHDFYGRLESPCVIFTTSGTTKAPKLVVHGQRNVASYAANASR